MPAPFTDDEVRLLIEFFAKHHPWPDGRASEKLLKQFDSTYNNNTGHSPKSWYNYYKRNKNHIDRTVDEYIQRGSHSLCLRVSSVRTQADGEDRVDEDDPSRLACSSLEDSDSSSRRPSLSSASQTKRSYSVQDDQNLIQYLAEQDVGTRRILESTFKALEDKGIDWAKTHTWKGWSRRYYRFRDRFDQAIQQYQAQNDLHVTQPRPSRRITRSFGCSDPGSRRRAMEPGSSQNDGTVDDRTASNNDILTSSSQQMAIDQGVNSSLISRSTPTPNTTTTTMSTSVGQNVITMSYTMKVADSSGFISTVSTTTVTNHRTA